MFQERKPRFLASEQAQGWHVQYNRIADESYIFIRDPSSLAVFDLDRARLELMVPAGLMLSFEKTHADRDELKRRGANLDKERKN